MKSTTPTDAPAVRIVHLSAAALRSLADGDLAGANAASPVPLTHYFAGDEWRSVWRMRAQQTAENPESAGWVTGVIWDENQELAVGRAGYHGPPQAGIVEVGYAVVPQYRRRGYARAALQVLLARAAHDPEIHTVRASISPHNHASYALVAQYGFAKVGEHCDDEDGLEYIYQTPSH